MNFLTPTYDLCKDVDIKDTPFVALAIELGPSLWTGDKKLKEGLKQKGFDNFLLIDAMQKTSKIRTGPACPVMLSTEIRHDFFFY